MIKDNTLLDKMSNSKLFLETYSSEKLISKIKKGEWTDIINHMCYIDNNCIILDNHYFRFFATKETYNIILTHVIFNLDAILLKYDEFTVHINMINVNISDIDKHLNFIKTLSGLLKEKYPNKLTKCYIHNPPFVFSQILNIISLFIDKETRDKIIILSKH